MSARNFHLIRTVECPTNLMLVLTEGSKKRCATPYWEQKIFDNMASSVDEMIIN